MADVRFLDIDAASAEGAALIERVSRRHGERLARVVQRTNGLFLLRSGWAPGLCLVGAQAHAPGLPGATAQGMFNFGGCGATVEDGLVSCLGETVERLSQIERDGDIVET